MLKQLFPALSELTADWPLEKWLMLPIALVWLLAPLSDAVHDLMGWN